MSQSKEEILVDYLDRSLRDELPGQTADFPGQDEESAEIWKNLCLSVDIIREAGLREQVSRVRIQFEQESGANQKPLAVVHRIKHFAALRIAASVLLLAGASILYKYATTNPESCFDKYYTGYNLSTGRGNNQADPLEQAYRQRNWMDVISLGKEMGGKDNKALFLSGMAAMELKQYNESIDYFDQVLQRNRQTGGDYFQDEAEYYLAMSYLAVHQTAKGIAILEKIKHDPNHLYYRVVNGMSFIDLGILRYKAGQK